MIYITPKIETKRLLLKKEVSLEEYLEVNEFSFFYLYGIHGEIKYKKNDLEEYKKHFLENLGKEYEDSIRWYIFQKEDSKIIGILGAYNIDIKENSIEIMINIHPNYWKQGYGYEALKSVIEYLFEELKFNTIIYTYDEGNQGSMKLANKLGFEFKKEFIVDYEDGHFNKVKNIRNVLSYKKYKSS